MARGRRCPAICTRRTASSGESTSGRRFSALRRAHRRCRDSEAASPLAREPVEESAPGREHARERLRREPVPCRVATKRRMSCAGERGECPLAGERRPGARRRGGRLTACAREPPLVGEMQIQSRSAGALDGRDLRGRVMAGVRKRRARRHQFADAREVQRAHLGIEALRVLAGEARPRRRWRRRRSSGRSAKLFTCGAASPNHDCVSYTAWWPQ